MGAGQEADPDFHSTRSVPAHAGHIATAAEYDREPKNMFETVRQAANTASAKVKQMTGMGEVRDEERPHMKHGGHE